MPKKETVSMSILVPVKLHRKFKAKTALEGRNESEVIRLFIRAYVNGFKLKELEKFVAEKEKGRKKGNDGQITKG